MTQEEKQCRCYNTVKGMGHDPICDCECHQPKPQEDWEKELSRILLDGYRKYLSWESSNLNGPIDLSNWVKKGTSLVASNHILYPVTIFIRTLIEKREKELVERIKNKEFEDIPHPHLFYGDTDYPAGAVAYGYNEAIGDIISIIEDK